MKKRRKEILESSYMPAWQLSLNNENLISKSKFSEGVNAFLKQTKQNKHNKSKDSDLEERLIK